MLFWLPFGLLQGVAAYVTTFVAQYTGAEPAAPRRPRRLAGVAPVSALSGLLFLAPLAPRAGLRRRRSRHTASMQDLEVTYLRVLSFAALPMLLTATVGGFFSGRGSPWAVLGINAAGTVVNGVLDYLLIFGEGGCPELGIAGAGWATVAGSWASAVVALASLLAAEASAASSTPSPAGGPERELFWPADEVRRPRRHPGRRGRADLHPLHAARRPPRPRRRVGHRHRHHLQPLYLPADVRRRPGGRGAGRAAARRGPARPRRADDQPRRPLGDGLPGRSSPSIFIAFPGPLVALFRPDIAGAADPAAAAAEWAEVSAEHPASCWPSWPSTRWPTPSTSSTRAPCAGRATRGLSPG